MRAETPRRIAAYATAAPWLPPEAATTPAGGRSRSSRLANAPRALKEPACCRCSALTTTWTAPRPISAPLASRIGVRRTCGRMTAQVASICSGVMLMPDADAADTAPCWHSAAVPPPLLAERGGTPAPLTGRGGAGGQRARPRSTARRRREPPAVAANRPPSLRTARRHCEPPAVAANGRRMLGYIAAGHALGLA